MIKLFILILIAILVIAFGYSTLNNDKSSLGVPNPTNTSPADTIQGAKDAVEQTQNVQDQLNQRAQDQLND